MTTTRTPRRKATRRGRRSSAGDDPARFAAPHYRLRTTAWQRLGTLSARPAILQPPAARRRDPIPFPRTMPAAAKSP
jgi:hypothetical protein